MRSFKKNVFLILLSFSFLGFTGKEKFIELNGLLNGRESARFTQDSSNILFTLGKNTKAEILGFKKFHSGNYGLHVRVASGPHKNKVIWVYHNVSNPTMALFENCPSDWTATTASCKGTKNPERAQASVATKQTAATQQAPLEIQNMPEIIVTPSADDIRAAQTETAADCKECSASKVQPQQEQTKTFVDQLVEKTSKTALTGAYRVMASMYQSCNVLNLPPVKLGRDDAMTKYINRQGRSLVVTEQNADEVAANHYYLKSNPQSKNPSCKDMGQTPPLYLYGGKASMSNGVLNIFAKAPTRGGVQTVGLDCSGFVSSAFSVAGLKLRASTVDASQNYASSRTLSDFNEKNSCFTRPSFTKNQTIQPSDVIAWKGHTFMIDTVGQDPFGIQKAKARGNFAKTIAECNRFQPPRSDLDFTIIQSTGAGNMPAMRIEAKNYGGTSVRSYLNLAIQACKAQFKSSQGSDLIVMPNLNSPVALLRHKGDSEPKCSFTKDKIPRLAGEECTHGCFKESP